MDDSFKKKLQKDALEAVVKGLEEKIASIVCPIHHLGPKLKFSEDSGPGEQKMSFDCCCERLSELLQKTLDQ